MNYNKQIICIQNSLINNSPISLDDLFSMTGLAATLLHVVNLELIRTD